MFLFHVINRSFRNDWSIFYNKPILFLRNETNYKITRNCILKSIYARFWHGSEMIHPSRVNTFRYRTLKDSFFFQFELSRLMKFLNYSQPCKLSSHSNERFTYARPFLKDFASYLELSFDEYQIQKLSGRSIKLIERENSSNDLLHSYLSFVVRNARPGKHLTRLRVKCLNVHRAIVSHRAQSTAACSIGLCAPIAWKFFEQS